MADSREEVDLLLDLLGQAGAVTVANGADPRGEPFRFWRWR